jgi:hypothetical protein
MGRALNNSPEFATTFTSCPDHQTPAELIGNRASSQRSAPHDYGTVVCAQLGAIDFKRKSVALID